jgi:hypothetical protein
MEVYIFDDKIFIPLTCTLQNVGVLRNGGGRICGEETLKQPSKANRPKVPSHQGMHLDPFNIIALFLFVHI